MYSLVDLQCTMHVRCAPMSALKVYTARAVYFMHTLCVCAVRCESLLHTGVQITPLAHVVQMWSAPCVQRVGQ